MTFTGDELFRITEVARLATGGPAFDAYLAKHAEKLELERRREALALVGAPIDLDLEASVAAVRPWLVGQLGLPVDAVIRQLEQGFYALPRPQRENLAAPWRWLVPHVMDEWREGGGDLCPPEEGADEPETAPATSPPRLTVVPGGRQSSPPFVDHSFSDCTPTSAGQPKEVL